MAQQSAASGKENTVLGNTVKLTGDLLFPGTSLMVDGRFKEGAVHSVLGWVGKAALGPIAWAVVAANSFSRSTTGKNLYDNIFDSHSKGSDK